MSKSVNTAVPVARALRAALNCQPLRGLAPSRNFEVYIRTSMPKHLNQTIHAKAIDLSPHQIANSGLCDLEQLGCRRLRKPSLLDQLRDFDHQIGAHSEIQCLLRFESEICENIITRLSKQWACSHSQNIHAVVYPRKSTGHAGPGEEYP